MNEARECFSRVDATGLLEGDSYTFNLNINPTHTVTVEFEEVVAASEEELEALLDEKAAKAIEESEADLQDEVGYEVVREEEEHRPYWRGGFIVTAPYL